jgi:hypothetical protein
VTATHYDVQVDADLADQAVRLLGRAEQTAPQE